MKWIAYVRKDAVTVLRPAPGARLALTVTLNGETRVAPAPRPVEQFFGRMWPIDGAVAQWAESEDAFVHRIARADVPAGLPYDLVDEGTRASTLAPETLSGYYRAPQQGAEA